MLKHLDRNWIPLALLSAAFLLPACQSTPSPKASISSSPASSAAAPANSPSTASAAPSQASFVAKNIQDVNAPLNQTQQYALTSDDLALLQSQGLLVGDDPPALQQLTKK